MPNLTAEQILAQQSKEYASAEGFQRWQPPDGLYLEVIESAECRLIGDDAAGVFVTGRIVEGPYEGKTNGIGAFCAAWKTLGGLKDIITILGGDDMPNPLAAAEFIKTKVGTVINVEVTTRRNKKSGVLGTYASVKSAVGDTDAGIAQPTSPE